MQNLLGRRVGVPAAEWGEDDASFYWGSIVQLGVDTQGNECVGIQLDGGRLFHWPSSLVLHWLETQPMLPAAKRARVGQGHPPRRGPPATQPDFCAHGEEPGVSLGLASCERGVADAPIRLQRDAKGGRRQLPQGPDFSPLVCLSRPLVTARPMWRRTVMTPGFEEEFDTMLGLPSHPPAQQASDCAERQVGMRTAAIPAVHLNGMREGTTELPHEASRSCGRQAELCRAAPKSGELEDGSADGAKGPAAADENEWPPGPGEDLASCKGARLRNGSAASWNGADVQQTDALVAVCPTVKGEGLSVGTKDAAQSPPCVGAGDGAAPHGDADPPRRCSTARPQGGDQLPYSDDDATATTDEKNNNIPAGPAPVGDAAAFSHPTGQGEAASSGLKADSQQEQCRAGGGGRTASTAAMEGARPCLPPRPRGARPGMAPARPPASQAAAEDGAQLPAAGTSGCRQHKQAGGWEAPKGSLGAAGAQAPVPRNGASALAAGIPLGRCIY